MLKRSFIGVLALILFLLPINAMAQRMKYGKWWQRPEIAKQINLTDEEKTRLDNQFVESRRKMIDLKSNLEKEQFELENLLEAKDLDEKAVRKQRQRLEEARSALGAERFELILQTRKILGYERFQQVKAHMQMARPNHHWDKGKAR